jgi:hypothetical protein
MLCGGTKGLAFHRGRMYGRFGAYLLVWADAAEDLYAARASVYSVADSADKALLASSLLRQYAELTSSARVLARAAALTGDASVTPAGLARQLNIQAKRIPPSSPSPSHAPHPRPP